MTRILYRDFLSDPDEYAACEKHWQQLIHRVAASSNQASEWKRWIPRQQPDGTPVERDGNPIYDARAILPNRGIRIIQHVCSGDAIELTAWIKDYEDEFTDLPREELIINLCLSEESSALAERLLCKWMSPATDRVSMQSFLDDLSSD